MVSLPPLLKCLMSSKVTSLLIEKNKLLWVSLIFHEFTLTGSAVILYLLADPLHALFITHCSETHPPKGRNEFHIISVGIKREWHSYSSFSNSSALSCSEILSIVHIIFQLCCYMAYWLHPASWWEKHQGMLWLSTAWSEKDCTPLKSADKVETVCFNLMQFCCFYSPLHICWSNMVYRCLFYITT